MNYQATDYFRRIQVSVSTDFEPDSCPRCHQHITPEESQVPKTLSGTQNQLLEIVYRCPNRLCGHLFIAGYERSGNQGSYVLRSCLPFTPISPILPEAVTKISPNYLKILLEASYAESLGLKNVCGPAYRKALEFLVKDFIIHKSAELGTTPDEVKNLPLGICISKYIDDSVTKTTAERAAWLGNDETHYTRIWGDKDLADLKKLIHIAQNAIDSQLIAEEYLMTMPPKNASGVT